MAIRVISFRTSESLFAPCSKVRYPHLIHCFYVKSILFLQFIIISSTESYFLLISIKASSFQFLVHITAGNIRPKLTHSSSFFPAQSLRCFTLSLQVSVLTLWPGLPEKSQATPLARMAIPCLSFSMTQIRWSHTVLFPTLLFTNQLCTYHISGTLVLVLCF